VAAEVAARPLRVMISGPPAAGKGTQCAKIVDKVCPPWTYTTTTTFNGDGDCGDGSHGDGDGDGDYTGMRWFPS
jgi:hypothetical protein